MRKKIKSVKAWAVLEHSQRRLLGSFAYSLVIYNRRRDAKKFHAYREVIPVLITPINNQTK